MLYRRALPEESRSIAEVVVNTWKWSYRNIFSSSYLENLSYEEHEAAISRQIEKKNDIFFTAVYNERVVGMVSGRIIEEGEYDCELDAIYILPEFQHRGTGKILFSMITDEFRESGADTMILWTFKENRERGFYRKMGGRTGSEKVISIENRDIVHVSYTWRDLTLF